jgi:hypothetical protein
MSSWYNVWIQQLGAYTITSEVTMFPSPKAVWSFACFFCITLAICLPSFSQAQSINFVTFRDEVGSGLQSSYSTARLSDSQHGGITMRIASGDTMLALVSADENTVGTEYVDVFVPNGSIDVRFYIHGLEDTTGTVTITATAPGFTDANDVCSIVQPGVRVYNLSSSIDVLDPDDDFLVQVGLVGGGGAYLVELNKVRAGSPGLTATVTNSNASAAQLVTTPVTGQVVTVQIAAGSYQSPTTVAAGGVAFDGLAAGTSDVTGTIPGFITTGTATQSVTVEASYMTITSLPAEIGSGLQSYAARATLSGTAHGGVTVHIESGDSTLLLISDAYTTEGHGSLDIFVPDGQSYATFYAQALEDTTGIVVINASAPGFTSANEATQIITPAFDIYGLATSIDVFDPTDPFYIRVGIPKGDLSAIYQTQQTRGGGPGMVATLVSSDSMVGEFVTLSDTSHTLTITIPPAEYRSPTSVALGGIAFDGIGLGLTSVSASIPDLIPTAAAYVDVDVTQPEITFLTIDKVGAGLRSGSTRAQLGATQHGGVTVHIEVDDPDIALVSIHGDSVGVPSVDIELSNGSYLAYYYIHGVEDTTGTVTLIASAPGFVPDTMTVDIVQPGIRLYSTSLLGTIDTLDPPDPFQVSIGVPNGDSTAVTAMEIRPGSPGITVTAISSLPSIGILQTLTDTSGTVTTSVAAGESRSPTSVAGGGVEFNGIAPGTTSVSVSAPGFIPMTTASQDVIVTSPTISWMGLPCDVGAGLQTASLRAGLSTTTHGGVTVRIESTDPDLVLLSAAEDQAGQTYVDVVVDDGSMWAYFYAHGMDDTTGSVTITATCPGFTGNSESVDVVQPALDIRDLASTIDMSDPPDAFVVAVGVGDVSFTHVYTKQKRRFGAPPLVATVASSVPGIGELMTLSDTSGTVTVNIDAGEWESPAAVIDGGIALRGISLGQTIVSGTIPGFIQTGDGTRTVDVTNQSIAYLGLPPAVGAGLQSGAVTARLGESLHGGVTVHIVSDSPSLLLVSAGAATAGTEFIDIVLPNGQADATFYIHGVDDTSGTATITASAPTFNDGVTLFDIVIPALQIASLPDTVDIVEGDEEFIVQVGIPESDSSSVLELQTVRAGGTAQIVTISSSDSVVAALVTTPLTNDTVSVTIPTGTYQTAATVAGGGVAFRPNSNGVVTIRAELPGFISTAAATKPVYVVGDLSDIGRGSIPNTLVLEQNVPNPFNPVTTIVFELDRATNITLTVYDVTGRKIRTLENRSMTPGVYKEQWDGRDTQGDIVASGVYFYRLHAGERALTKKMVFLK